MTIASKSAGRYKRETKKSLLAEALVRRMPNDGYRCFFTNSGAPISNTSAIAT